MKPTSPDEELLNNAVLASDLMVQSFTSKMDEIETLYSLVVNHAVPLVRMDKKESIKTALLDEWGVRLDLIERYTDKCADFFASQVYDLIDSWSSLRSRVVMIRFLIEGLSVCEGARNTLVANGVNVVTLVPDTGMVRTADMGACTEYVSERVSAHWSDEVVNNPAISNAIDLVPAHMNTVTRAGLDRHLDIYQKAVDRERRELISLMLDVYTRYDQVLPDLKRLATQLNQ